MTARAALLVLAAAAAAAQDATDITVAEYADRLDAIAGTLEQGDATSARNLAADLGTRIVLFDGERLSPDRGLRGAVKEEDTGKVRLLARRFRFAAAAVRGTAPEEAPAPDAGLVRQLRETDQIARGGTMPEASIAPLSERIVEGVTDAFVWVWERMVDLWHWLRRFWPRRAPGKETSGGGLTFTLVVVALAVIALVLLAIRTMRRSRPVEVVDTVPVAGAADEDPLSRETNEWEAYARELAAAGRRREAVRAWYHAVLSALFRAGWLEPRKGRTNWEHVAGVGADVRWRPELIRITRDFEREWYGRDESAPEALHQCAQAARGILQALHAGGPA
jgi:hypothetical protein